MQFLTLSTLVLILFAAYSTAQVQTCTGSAFIPNCVQPLSWGFQGPGCSRVRVMWWYDSSVNICRQINYLGCGGNGNRWCSLAACNRRCRR